MYTLIPLLIAMAFSMIASIRVRSAFSKYDQVMTAAGVPSQEVARRLLRYGGITQVPVMRTAGNLSDNYHPTENILYLSESTYGRTSVAAIGVAAHETGHAMQDEEGYSLLKLRSSMVPVVNIGSNLGLILCIIGSFLTVNTSIDLVQIGIVLYSLTFIFTLVTLPVELNASRRAMDGLRSLSLYSEEELKGARKVLSAAALTYVAAMFAALMNLLRIIAIFGGGRRRR